MTDTEFVAVVSLALADQFGTREIVKRSDRIDRRILLTRRLQADKDDVRQAVLTMSMWLSELMDEEYHQRMEESYRNSR